MTNLFKFLALLAATLPFSSYGYQISLYNKTFQPMYVEIINDDTHNEPVIIQPYKKSLVTLPQHSHLRIFSCIMYPTASTHIAFKEELYTICASCNIHEIKLMKTRFEVIL